MGAVSHRHVPVLEIEVTTPVTAEVTGRHVLLALDRAGCPRQYLHRPPSRLGPRWAIPAVRIADVEAAVETLRGRCEVRTTIGCLG